MSAGKWQPFCLGLNVLNCHKMPKACIVTFYYLLLRLPKYCTNNSFVKKIFVMHAYMYVCDRNFNRKCWIVTWVLRASNKHVFRNKLAVFHPERWLREYPPDSSLRWWQFTSQIIGSSCTLLEIWTQQNCWLKICIILWWTQHETHEYANDLFELSLCICKDNSKRSFA